MCTGSEAQPRPQDRSSFRRELVEQRYTNTIVARIKALESDALMDEIWKEPKAAKRKEESADAEAALKRNMEEAKRKEEKLAAQKRELEEQQMAEASQG
ncbi:hypothetical protein F5887DRAFT_1072626 [Amanita rubescens]|nr:hypothetical protein F5887DRAFT_1072626 [Amanita rubescens]